MDLKIKHFVIIITIGLSISCRPRVPHLTKIEGKEIAIDSSLIAATAVENYVRPYRDRVNEVLDSALAYAPKKITKNDGRYNTSAGNLLADIIFEETSPILKSRTGHTLDFVLLNHGGIRSIISQGKVTARTAFEVMPFENTIVIVELSGVSVKNLVSYLLKDTRPHPISGLQIVLDKNSKLAALNIQGKPFNEKNSYFVATSDYLAAGGDDMAFFKDALSITRTDYFVRNAMIDYFKKVDTIAPKVDDRFYRLEQ